MQKVSSILISILVLFLFFSCSSKGSEKQKDPTDQQIVQEKEKLTNIIKDTKYERYFLFKGSNLESVKDGLDYWSKTYRIDWVVKESTYKDWVLVKMVKEDIVEMTDFHNMPSYFFNKPDQPIKINEDHIGIAIAIDPLGKNTYLAYVTKEIHEEGRVIDPMSCDLYAVFQNNKKGIVSACFPGVFDPMNRTIPNFEEILTQYNINLEEIQNDSLSGEIIKIKSDF